MVGLRSQARWSHPTALTSTPSRRFFQRGRLVELVVERFQADAEFFGRLRLIAAMAIQGVENGLDLLLPQTGR